VLRNLPEAGDRQAGVAALKEELKQKEEYIDEMREQLNAFLMECAKGRINPSSERRLSRLLRVIPDLEDMSDECYSISIILEKSVKKDRLFKEDGMIALVPYVKLVEDFLSIVRKILASAPTTEMIKNAMALEKAIDKSRNKLRKFGRKRIESGEHVKTELHFIDLVRRIEKLGDYCLNITETVAGNHRRELPIFDFGDLRLFSRKKSGASIPPPDGFPEA
jgi:phosphate:Na+ symporter